MRRVKVYYFVCSKCGQRKRQKPNSEESADYGVCKACYMKAADAYDAAHEWEIDQL